MRAMILAAGRGKRMRPLTDTMPKPLLQVAGKSLIEYHIEALAQAGIKHIVINHAWLGEKIEAQLGDGSRYGVSLQYSREGTALETAGGIKKALSLLGNEPFIVVNGDLLTDYPFAKLMRVSESLDTQKTAYLVLVNNPEHHPQGDFYCQNEQVYERIDSSTELAEALKTYTFSGIACYRPEFFSNLQEEKQALAPMLRSAMAQQQVEGEVYEGFWCDVGTPERLKEVNDSMSQEFV